MQCNEKNRTELIEKYILNELSGDEMRSFEDHFLSCDDCFSELSATNQLKEFIKDEGNVLFEEYIYRTERESSFNLFHFLKELFIPSFSFKPVLTYAFTAVLSGLIIISVFNQRISSDLNSPSARLLELQQIYPSDFSVSSDLESLVSQEYRSSIQIKVNSPLNGIETDKNIQFDWKMNKDQKLGLKILNNKEEVVLQANSLSNKFDVDIEKEGFKPGIYYWKLETENDLLYVGKFFVK